MLEKRPEDVPVWKGVGMTLVTLGPVCAIVFVVVWGFFEGWGQGEWGPAAAWFSGLLTAGAVSIALWQAFESKRRTIADAAAAQERLIEERMRHTAELRNAKEQTAASDRRHAEQLELLRNHHMQQLIDQRRKEDIRSIRLITETLDNIFQEGSRFSFESQNLAQCRLSSETQTSYSEAFDRWFTLITAANAKVEAALIDMDDEHLFQLCRKAADQLDELPRALFEPRETAPNWDKFKEIMDKAFILKQQIKDTARLNLHALPSTERPEGTPGPLHRARTDDQ